MSQSQIADERLNKPTKEISSPPKRLRYIFLLWIRAFPLPFPFLPVLAAGARSTRLWRRNIRHRPSPEVRPRSPRITVSLHERHLCRRRRDALLIRLRVVFEVPLA